MVLLSGFEELEFLFHVSVMDHLSVERDWIHKVV